MQDMRFNPPIRPKDEIPKNENLGAKKRRWLWAAILLAVFVSGALIFVFWPLLAGIFSPDNSYSAVFLGNGQVYFGKMVKKNNSEIVLQNVYYFQTNEATTTKTKLELTKLGSEVYGPTDQIFINTSQVVFYEKLRDDSKLVESIKNYK